MQKKEITYQELKPSEHLEEFVHSFWMHKNNSDIPELLTIFPDSFFKIIFIVQENKIINYFMTGIWSEQKEFIIPAKTTTFGCRLKILAPEFLIKEEISVLHNTLKELDIEYLNLKKYFLSDFDFLVKQWESELTKQIATKEIQGNKSRLSQLLYQTKGNISATEVSEQIFWTNRQINRYLNKFIGVSLKKYLNIQKCYTSYLHIRAGEFHPKENYFDQAHFIKEVKKHTGETPKSLYYKQNDQFIQLKHIQ